MPCCGRLSRTTVVLSKVIVGERDDVEEVGALEVSVALGVVGVDALGLDRQLELRVGRVFAVEGDAGLGLAEHAVGVAHVHVADAEHDREVGLIEVEDVGGPSGRRGGCGETVR